MPDNIKSKVGHIKSFDGQTAKGKVSLGNRDVPFDATCFDSGRPRRAPEAGQRVRVLFSEGDVVLAVRAETET
jgi:hypothetical protein